MEHRFPVECWHGEYCIPELPQRIADADISEELLSNYERNFRILVFDTSLGEMVETQEECSCTFGERRMTIMNDREVEH